MAELNREVIIAALQGFTAARDRMAMAYTNVDELVEVVGLDGEICPDPETIQYMLYWLESDGAENQAMLDLGALLLRLGLETIGLPTGFDNPEPQASPKPRSWKLSDVDRLLFATAYDVMQMAGGTLFRPLPAAPQAFADAPDLWRQAHGMACARE